MKFLKLTGALLLFFSIVSCEKDKATVIEGSVTLTVMDSQGNNLLPTVYNEDNIKVYHVINGQAELFYNPKYDKYTKGFIMDKYPSGNYVIHVFLNINRPAKTTLTLVKFGDSKTDTLTLKYKYRGSSAFIEKV